MHTRSTDTALRTLGARRILPLVDTDAPEQMADLADAFLRANLPVVEVTLRRPRSLEALEQLAAIPDMIVGAGTVMTDRHVGQAVDAGARFLVSPGLSLAVVEEASRLDVPIVPGVASPTELMAALDAGITTVKFFPAAVNGGPAAIRAMAAVAPTVSWIPTGGIDSTTAPSYLDIPTVLAVGGSWMCPASLVDAGRWSEIAPLLDEASVLAK
ncbi:bifunctional 4-hydroxy-2-oxoglutarate aldolase/2-dehydro-3-deoxy-phosphogluconate aldolase [Microbacterium sp. Bi128]|uniref:bifunctional 4-hydroxy-2-oxoglutarate aldolase/2-dehydro-3-deoxy-phosphogluconate aldolase n=1 Tax=Microbacterium sp. Bi128 TaxID=2821115 RepID=UPI001D67EAE1|nr:bifunctional 4-hydroxy-2-oxoglutarate aldolase/2-dehydro-3-deoxy-phosphogluconate aldolase [Microbacterium sp. Bi128]CAH0136994.1 KHG/KDPG aldolase [Microbacterium sp. Bi128]